MWRNECHLWAGAGAEAKTAGDAEFQFTPQVSVNKVRCCQWGTELGFRRGTAEIGIRLSLTFGLKCGVRVTLNPV